MNIHDILAGNYRNMESLCRCIVWDYARKCELPDCRLFHDSVDCRTHAATGVCAEPDTCTLAHDARKHAYSLMHPYSPRVTPLVRAAWSSVQEFRQRLPRVNVGMVFRDKEEMRIWRKIKREDYTKTLDLGAAIYDILRRHKSNWADIIQILELLLREHNMLTFLIARPGVPPGDQSNWTLRTLDGTPAPYRLIVTVAPQEQALVDITLLSGSYAENIARLRSAGFMFKHGYGYCA